MRPNDTMERLVRQLKYRAAPEFRSRACKSMLAELDEASSVKPQSIWRIVMTSKTTHCVTAIAAAAVLAFLVLPLGGPLDNDHVVWAEVVKKTAAIDTLTLREKRVCYKLGQEEPTGEATVSRQASGKLGIVERQYDADGKLMHVAYFLKKDKRFLIVFPGSKMYLEVLLGDESVALMEDFSPKGLVKLLTHHGYTKLEPTELDGRRVEGFQMSKKQVEDLLSIYNYKKYGYLFPVNELTIRLYVDVETSLPVRTESDFTTSRGLLTGFNELRCHFEAYDIQWGAKIDPEDFVPNIPDDYERVDLNSPEVRRSKGEEKASDH